MGYDLKPRNKDIGWFHFGAFSWSWMLNAGVGLVIGYGKAKDPASFSYIPDKKGRCPGYNDGYYVCADLAWAMAHAANGLVVSQHRIRKEWAAMSEDERQKAMEWNKRHKIYQEPVREDFIDLVEKFVQWAQKSHGFGIF